MQWTDEKFRILGLGDTEIALLVASATAKSIQELHIVTKISRTGIKYSLEQLSQKGLVQRYKNGKRYLFVSVGIPDVARMFESISREVHLEQGGVKGARIRTSKENEFTIHVGIREIIPAYSRIASTNKNERVRGLQHHRSYKEITEKASGKLLAEFNGAIIKNNIVLEGILNESAYESYLQEMTLDPKKFRASVESLQGRAADYYVFPDDAFNFDAELWIFKETALIINWHEEVAVEITNTNMTGFLKDMFEFVKLGSKKIDHNAMLRKVLADTEQPTALFR